MTDIELAKLRRDIAASTEALGDVADAAAKVLDTLCIVLLHCGFSHEYIIKASADLGADWADGRDSPSWREDIDAMRQMISDQERAIVQLRCGTASISDDERRAWAEVAMLMREREGSLVTLAKKDVMVAHDNVEDRGAYLASAAWNGARAKVSKELAKIAESRSTTGKADV